MTEPEPVDPESQSQLLVSTQLPKYTCVCKEKFYIPNKTIHGFASEKIESEGGNFSCVPCPEGCLVCNENGICLHGNEEPEEFLTESLLRACIGAILGACVGCCVLMSFIIFRQRKCKVSCLPEIEKYSLQPVNTFITFIQTIATGMWTILETILVGIIFLYSAVSLEIASW